MLVRSEFSKPVKRTAYERSGGICECHRIQGVPGFIAGGCGQPLGPGNVFYEHVDPDGAGGKPTLENCAVLTKTCWRIKTDTFDQRVVAKTKRMSERAAGIGRRNGPPMMGSKASGWRRPMNGRGERRI